MQKLSGYKTYLIGAAMVVLSGLHTQGYISQEVYEILQNMLLGGGLMALRAGVKKVA